MLRSVRDLLRKAVCETEGSVMVCRRQRWMMVLALFLSHLLMGTIVYYCMIIDDPYYHYITKPRIKHYSNTVQLQSYLDLPIQGFVNPAINNQPCKPAPPPNNPTIFVITPTHARVTQKLELISLCYTFALVPDLVWIVIEDSTEKTSLVRELLATCPVKSVHLNVPSPKEMARKWWHWTRTLHHRGVLQRNAGIAYLRDNYSKFNCNGVVYFADDDNRYDIKLFETMRHTKKLSVWPVGLVSYMTYEGPVCRNGSTVTWRYSHPSPFTRPREIELDMAGFAVQLCQFFEKPYAQFNGTVGLGQLENTFMLQFVSGRSEVECLGSDKEVLVWHIKTAKPDLSREQKYPPKYQLEV